MADGCSPVWVNILLSHGLFMLTSKEGFYPPRGSNKPVEKPGVLLQGAKGIFPMTYLDQWTKGPPSLAHCQAFSARLMTHVTTQTEASWGLSNKAYNQPGDRYSLHLKFPSCTLMAHYYPAFRAKLKCHLLQEAFLALCSQDIVLSPLSFSDLCFS